MFTIFKNILRPLYYFYNFSLTAVFLRLKNVQYGKKPLFMVSHPLIRCYGKMTLGDNFRISCAQFKSELFTGKNGALTIGNNVFINRGVSISAQLSIEIGDNCLIADMVSIQDSNWHEVDQNSVVKVAQIIIGKNVWIGRNAVILPGVTIGDHCVIAAGTIIAKDVPPKTMVYQERKTVVKKLSCDDDYKRP